MMEDAMIPRFSMDSRAGAYMEERLEVALGEELKKGLKRIGEKYSRQPDIVVKAVWAIVLHRYTGSEDICFASQTERGKGFEECRTFFKCGEDSCFSALLESAEENEADPGTAENKGFAIRISSKGSISASLIYDASIYRREVVCAASGHFIKAAQAAVTDTGLSIKEIEILTADEKRKILHVFNATRTEYPRSMTIHELFREQAEACPGNIAVEFCGRHITYDELNRRSDRIAGVLIEKGVKRESIVAIMLPRSIEAIIGMLAVLKAGGAYLPVDPGYPGKRKAYMLEDSGARVLLTMSYIKPVSEAGAFTSLCLDDEGLYRENGIEACCAGTAENLAYIMYTSGSTGKPKGTMIEHRNVVRLVKNTNYIEFKKEDRILQTGAIVFDACTFEIWGALLNGLSLCLETEDTILDACKLKESLTKNRVTILWLTSPLFNRLSDREPEMFSALRVLMVGGDVLSPRHINNVLDKCPGLTVINGYGPTENTTFSTCFTIDGKHSRSIPIGKPISNSTAYIVDKYCRLQPVGVPGELWVGGDGVGRGYISRRQQANEKFIDSPFADGERVYKTGDAARWLPDGSIEFLGRIDNQAKIRGFRVEPGEVEAELMKNAEIKQAAVIARAGNNGDRYLCAYLVCDREFGIAELKSGVLKELPDYMIPSYFIRLEAIPLTQNGKVDRERLPEPDMSAVRSGGEYAAPRNEREGIVAGIWESILGTDRVGITDNFFELGGDSLKAFEIASNASYRGIRISVRDILKHMTVAKIMDNAVNGPGDNELPDQFTAVQQKYKLKDYMNNASARAEDMLLTGGTEEIPLGRSLKTVMQRDITTYLHRSLPLCAVLAHDKYLPWYYCNFIQIFSFTDQSGYVELNYLEPRDCCAEIMDMVCLGYHLLKNEGCITDFIIEKINMGYYVIINMDEYCLPNKLDYNKNHFVHPSLIYGYDSLKRELKGIGFNAERLFTELVFDYTELSSAYESGKIYYKDYAPWCGWSAVQLIRPKSFDGEYPFSMSKFLNDLGQYIFSKPDSARLYSFEYPQAQVSFGLNVYDVVLKSMGRMLEGRLTIDYRALHLLWEHKKCIYDRLDYIMSERYSMSIRHDISKNSPGEKIQRLHREYRGVVEQFNNIRLQYLGQSFASFDEEKLSPGQQDMIHKVISELGSIKSVEQRLLQEIYNELLSAFKL